MTVLRYAPRVSIGVPVYNGERYLGEALDSFVEKVTSAWTNSNPQDAAGREKLWHLLRAAQEFKAFIQATVDSGKIARMELENSRLSKLKRALRIAS